MPYPVNTFSNFAELYAYINSNWVTNGNEDIDAVIGNNVVNALLTFIEQSPINWQTADVINSSTGVVVQRPVNVFITSVPSQVSFVDNIYNQYIFVNTLASDIPLASGYVYYDIDLNVVNSIPSKSVVYISKAKNSLWISTGSGSSSTGGGVKSAITGIVDGGGADDPVSGQSLFQSDDLIGLGASKGGKITIQIDGANMYNYGGAKSFEFDYTLGLIDLNYNGSGNEWQPNSTLFIDRNQP